MNLLKAAFTSLDLKNAKMTIGVTVFFELLGSARVKAACKTLIKLTSVDLKLNLFSPLLGHES